MQHTLALPPGHSEYQSFWVWAEGHAVLCSEIFLPGFLSASLALVFCILHNSLLLHSGLDDFLVS